MPTCAINSNLMNDLTPVFHNLAIQLLTLYATGYAKSHNENRKRLITFKIELRRNFPIVCSFFIPYSTRKFHKIGNIFKFIKTMAKTLRNKYPK